MCPHRRRGWQRSIAYTTPDRQCRCQPKGDDPSALTRKLYRAGVIQLAVETHVTQCRRTGPMASPADASAQHGLPQVLGTPASRTSATPSWPLTAAVIGTIARASGTQFIAARWTGRGVMRDGEQTRAARHEEAQGDTDQGQGSIAGLATIGAWLAVMNLRWRINTGTSGTGRMETPPAPCVRDRITPTGHPGGLASIGYPEPPAHGTSTRGLSKKSVPSPRRVQQRSYRCPSPVARGLRCTPHGCATSYRPSSGWRRWQRPPLPP